MCNTKSKLRIDARFNLHIPFETRSLPVYLHCEPEWEKTNTGAPGDNVPYQMTLVYQTAAGDFVFPLTSATSGRPRDWKQSWELLSSKLGPSKAVLLEGGRAVLLVLSGDARLAANQENKDAFVNSAETDGALQYEHRQVTVDILTSVWSQPLVPQYQ